MGVMLFNRETRWEVMTLMRRYSLHRSEGFPARSYLVPAHGTPGVLPDGQSCWDAVVVAVSWCYRGASAPRSPHPAWLARNKSWPKRSRSPSVPIPLSWNGPEVHRFQSHGLEMGRKSTGSNPSVFPDLQVIPECLVLQYFQIQRSSECLVLWCPKV